MKDITTRDVSAFIMVRNLIIGSVRGDTIMDTIADAARRLASCCCNSAIISFESSKAT
jgi:hypothetical protein